MIVTAKLDESQLVETEIITESESYLEEHGFRCDPVEYHLVVNQKPQSENSGYIVKTVETTRVPFAESDLERDRIEIQICSCAAYRYSDGIEDLEESSELRYSPCKHCSAVDKTLKAQNDDSQATLD